MKHGKIYLVPTIIASNTQHAVISPKVMEILPGIRHFLAEEIRTARRFLSSLKIYESIDELHFEVLNKDTDLVAMKKLLAPVFNGELVGILSESGCPGIADPGALAVKFAHEQGIQVVPLVGPSSILLALMASGLNGQCFAFQGYLPIKPAESVKSIRVFEKESGKKNQTQIFIETPYRSDAIFQLLIRTLREDTLLCIALDITGEGEEIVTHPVKQWKLIQKKLSKVPTVFLFLAT
jgi:16S rRNA (cytidine1402-2'-O)-methyltransferase